MQQPKNFIVRHVERVAILGGWRTRRRHYHIIAMSRKTAGAIANTLIMKGGRFHIFSEDGQGGIDELRKAAPMIYGTLTIDGFILPTGDFVTAPAAEGNRPVSPEPTPTEDYIS